MIRIYIFLVFCFGIFINKKSLFAQTPTIRKVKTTSDHNIRNNPLEKRQVIKDTTPAFIGMYTKNPSVLKNTWATMFSLLEFSNFYGGGKEFPMEWEFKKTATKEIDDSPLSKNWKKTFTWRRIPAGTTYGRWEISFYPFPLQDMPGFSGVIQTGIIETKGADSVYFEINYIDAVNIQYRKRGEEMVRKKSDAKIKPTIQSGNHEVEISKRERNTPETEFKNEKLSALPVMQLFERDTRKFYIRIVPLDVNKKPLSKLSNEVSLQEVVFKGIPAPKKQDYLINDYTITAVKYNPIYYGDPNFANCAVITSYSFPEQTDKTKQKTAFGFADNDIFGLNQNQFASYFQAAFPIGTILCPQPPKQKAWYEKALNGIAGFTVKAWDGAVNFYNNTKGYIKDKFIELNCNANLVTTVMNPVTKLQQAAGPEVCGWIAEAAFDYSMAAVGIPPSLPTSDAFVKLAEGQLVELACDELESQTGVPLPEEARAAIQKEFHDKVVAQSGKGIMNCGFFNVKPDPRGLFQTAYFEIEITRTGNSFKGRGIASFGIEDLTTRTISLWNPVTKQNEAVFLKGNLFEPATVKIPYLENVGNKMKLYVFLKPQESYLHKDKKTNMINSVHHGPPLNEFYNPLPVNPSYYDITNSPGFNTLSGSGSVSAFSFGLKNFQQNYTNK